MTYDADGLRSTKQINGVRTDFQYVGDKLYYEKRGDNQEFYYFYDSYGNLSMIYYTLVGSNGSTTRAVYHAVTNAQGDVVALHNQNGQLVARYEYDAWGNTLSVTDANGNPITTWYHIANSNPIRYRGYYFDSDLGLYYLQSRYYDSEIGRFINADSIDYLGADGSPLSYNLFAYCLNNPVNRIDSNGTWSMPNWLKVTVGAVALAGAIALTIATGGTAAAVAVGVAKVVGSVVVSTAVSAGVGYLENGKQGAIDGACNGFMFGSLSACGGAALKYASSAATKVSVSSSVQEPKKIANTITGYTRHGLNQAIGRNGVGVKPSAILDAVRNPTSIVTKIDDLGRVSTQYRGTQSTVVLNQAGKIISCWAKSSKYWRV